MNETPKANRIHIAFFGLRNAGKSTLVNAFCSQQIAIVSDVAGTTTDPVSKAMEILPLGPCLVTDTAGLDDEGELGAMRVEKSLSVLATADIAVWVKAEDDAARSPQEDLFRAECAKRGVAVLEYSRGDSVEKLKKRIASVKISDVPRPLLEGIVGARDRVICVCPIDESAPKGRLILPQVQVIRECLDCGATCTVCQPKELSGCLALCSPCTVITDSQAFAEVKAILKAEKREARLTSFSILFARQKGDLDEYAKGVAALKSLRDGDTVLIAEGCTHHRQCNDIGTVKLPRAIERLTGKKLNFVFSSGGDFPLAKNGETPHPARNGEDQSPPHPHKRNDISLVVQCGGCMLTRREVMRRIEMAKAANVPIANYGMVLGAACGMYVAQGSAFVQL